MIFESEEFTNKTECKQQIKALKGTIYKTFNIEPKHNTLPHGTIILTGYIEKYKHWFYLTNIIGQFNKCIDWKHVSRYKLITEELTFNN